MPPALVSNTARFTAHGDTLDHPVDILGHANFRAKIDGTAITRNMDGGPIGFKGTAIVFNTRTWIGSRDFGYWEQIDPAAVTKTLGEADVRFLINHDPNLLLARNKANTLRISPGMGGLEVDADMAPTSYARDLAISLERGDINQMSFAFTPVSWTRSEAEDGKELVTINEMRLWDVSVVTYPAYETTQAGLRDAAFDALCRSHDLDPLKFLREFAETESTSAPAETTRSNDDDPAAQIAAVDAVIDAALKALDPTDDDYDPAQAAALLTAAEATIDGLLEMFGIPDADDIQENSAPAKTTRTLENVSPAETTERAPNPGDRLRELRTLELASHFKE